MPDSLSVCTSDQIPDADRERLWALWQAAFDGQGFDRDDEQHSYGGIHVLARSGEEILGHAAVVRREIVVGERPFETGYVEGVAVGRQTGRPRQHRHLMTEGLLTSGQAGDEGLDPPDVRGEGVGDVQDPHGRIPRRRVVQSHPASQAPPTGISAA